MKITTLIKETIALPPRFGITEEAEQERNELLLQSSQLKTCNSIPEANSVGEAARDIQTRLKWVDEMEMSYRRPINTALDALRATKNDYVKPYLEEKARLERLATDFAQAERRRVAEEERVRQAEIQRLERERRAAEDKARQEAERVARENREAEERARKAEAEITNKRQLEAAIKAEAVRKEEAAKRQAEADAQAEAAKKASEAAQAVIRAPLPEAHKIGGVTVKRVMRWEVTSITALVKARPDLCKIEAKPSAINAVCTPRFLKNSDEVDDTTVPGLKLWWEDDANTRKW